MMFQIMQERTMDFKAMEYKKFFDIASDFTL